MVSKSRLLKIETAIKAGSDRVEDRSQNFPHDYEITAKKFKHKTTNLHYIMKELLRRPEDVERYIRNTPDLDPDQFRYIADNVRSSSLQDWRDALMADILNHNHKIAFPLTQFNLEQFEESVLSAPRIVYHPNEGSQNV